MNLHTMHPALATRGNWAWKPEFRDLDAAQRWGCPTPAAFREMDKNDQIDVIAWYEARWRIDVVNAYERTKTRRSK